MSANSLIIRATPIPLPAQTGVPSHAEQNFAFLLRCKELNNLTVRNGLLAEGDFFDRCLNILKKILVFLKILSPQNTEMQQTLGELCASLASKITHISPTCHEAQKVKELFFRVLSGFSEESFDRRCVSETLQNFLSPKLAALRASPSADESSVFGLALEEVKLAVRLGVKPLLNGGGTTGSLIYRDVHYRKKGIFKAAQSAETSFFNAVRLAFKFLLGFRRQKQLCTPQLPEMYPEVAAYLTDRYFGFGFTPATSMIDLENKRGSFMLWACRCEEACAFKPCPGGPNDVELEMMQKFMIFDYLIGNLDCHTRNYLIRQDGGHLQRIIAIDHGLCFPQENPNANWSDTLIRCKQYHWRNHPFASRPFTAASRALMRSFSPVRMENFITHLKSCFNADAPGALFFSANALRLIVSRAESLMRLADEERSSPQTLAATS